MTAQAPIPEKKGLIAARVSRPRWWVIRGEMSGRTSAVLAALGLIAPFWLGGCTRYWVLLIRYLCQGPEQ